jgi:hypothetical protein
LNVSELTRGWAPRPLEKHAWVRSRESEQKNLDRFRLEFVGRYLTLITCRSDNLIA